MAGIELFLVAGLAAGAGLVSVVRHRSSQMHSIWRAAGIELGLAHSGTGFFEVPSLQGRHAGHQVVARQRAETDNNTKSTSRYCDVSVAIRMPLPAGLAIRSLSATERVLPNLSRAFSSRKEVYRDGRVVVEAAEPDAVAPLLADPRFRSWLGRQFDHDVSAHVISNCLHVKGYVQDSVRDIVHAVKASTRFAQQLETALMWEPAQGVQAPDALPLVAFGTVRPTEPVETSSQSGDSGAVGGSRTSTEQASPSLMSRMLADLESEGARDETGRFTLDREAALRKLRTSRVDRREVFALEVLRAASLRGASRVDVRADADDLWIAFDGRPFSRGELEQVYAAAFARDPDPAVQSCRHLALALEGALGDEPRYVAFRTPSVTLTRRPDEDDVLESTADAGEDVADSSCFHVKLRLAQRMRRRGFEEALELVRSHARFMTAEVRVAGQAVDQGPAPEAFVGRTRVCGQGVTAPIEGWVGFDASGPVDAPARAWLGRADVWIEALELTRAPPGLRVVVMAHDFDTDLSGQNILRNDAFDAAGADVDVHVGEAVVALAEHFRRRHERERTVDPALARRLRSLCAHTLSRADLSASSLRALEPGTPRYALLTAYCWPTVDDRTCSLRGLLGGREARRERPVPFCDLSVSALAGRHRTDWTRVWRAVEPHFATPTLYVAHLRPQVRAWLAARLGDRLSSRSLEMLEAASGL